MQEKLENYCAQYIRECVSTDVAGASCRSSFGTSPFTPTNFEALGTIGTHGFCYAIVSCK